MTYLRAYGLGNLIPVLFLHHRYRWRHCPVSNKRTHRLFSIFLSIVSAWKRTALLRWQRPFSMNLNLVYRITVNLWAWCELPRCPCPEPIWFHAQSVIRSRCTRWYGNGVCCRDLNFCSNGLTSVPSTFLALDLGGTNLCVLQIRTADSLH